MSYVWGSTGPGFEYPNSFRVENRFLMLRAATLWLTALVLFWLASAEPPTQAYVPGTTAAPTAGGTSAFPPLPGLPGVPGLPEVSGAQAPVESMAGRGRILPGSAVPHILVGLFFLALGIIDVVTVMRQRVLRLAEGQPAGLAIDLPSHSTGASNSATALERLATTGKGGVPELKGRYRRLVLAMASGIALSPTTLQRYVRTHGALLIWMSGLTAAFGLLWVTGRQLPAFALTSLLFAAVSMAYVAYCAWISKEASSPAVLGSVAGFTMLAGAGLLFVPAGTPRLAQLQALSLPMAAGWTLLTLVACELLAVLAARKQVDRVRALDSAAAPARVALAHDSIRVHQEVDAELMRRWSEGIPNRRYVRKGPVEAAADGADVVLVAFEETQPLLPQPQADRPQRLASARWPWLVVSPVLGLFASVVGCLLWVRMADALMLDARAPWTWGATALILVLVGAYAIRAPHLLWSRFELVSNLVRVVLRAPAVPAGGRETLGLEVLALRARSVMFAAGEHLPGSRTLLALAADPAAAQRFCQQVEGFLSKAPPPMATPISASSGKRATATAPVVAQTAVRAAVSAAPRFCPACGTPAVQHARFCAHCGNQLLSG